MAKLVGVTGGIGSGKTTVCRVLEALGVPVYYADNRAKALVANDPELKAAIIDLLGVTAYLSDGSYNRSWVAKQVFDTPELLQKLNALVHPKVYTDTQRWNEIYAHKPYIVKEAALLNKKTGIPLDFLVVVTAPLALKIQRIKTRDPQRSEAEIIKIINSQVPDNERITMADFIIENNNEKLLLPQIIAFHDKMRF
jgi:dephospho-CoA kinase